MHAWVGHQLASRKDKGAEALRALGFDFLGPLGERDLKSVSKGDLVAILDKIVARGARRQANKDLRELKQFYHWCEVANGSTAHRCSASRGNMSAARRRCAIAC